MFVCVSHSYKMYNNYLKLSSIISMYTCILILNYLHAVKNEQIQHKVISLELKIKEEEIKRKNAEEEKRKKVEELVKVHGIYPMNIMHIIILSCTFSLYIFRCKRNCQRVLQDSILFL